MQQSGLVYLEDGMWRVSSDLDTYTRNKQAKHLKKTIEQRRRTTPRVK
jgi:hypothetical protein